MLRDYVVLYHVAILSHHIDEWQKILSLDPAFVQVFRLTV